VKLAIDGSSQEDVLPFIGNVAYPAWYPARDVFAFVRKDLPAGTLGSWMVYIGSPVGAQSTPLIDPAPEGWMYSPALSPDGGMVAFTYESYGFQRELYVAELK
jgi:Tol biopolymer transport system component